MKKITTLFLFSIVLLGACSKDEDQPCGYSESMVVAPQSEINAVQAYLGTNGIAATQHPSGLFYVIETSGAGATAGLCNAVTVNYVGKLTNGTIFDQTTGSPATFTLGQLIIGWQKGLPLIKPGGKIKLYIPPTLGYGPNANGPIPANSILIFEMELVAVG
jgi:FKBP-type peptidyl-prolyl cis-trans isomerase FkpA